MIREKRLREMEDIVRYYENRVVEFDKRLRDIEIMASHNKEDIKIYEGSKRRQDAMIESLCRWVIGTATVLALLTALVVVLHWRG